MILCTMHRENLPSHAHNRIITINVISTNVRIQKCKTSFYMGDAVRKAHKMTQSILNA